MALFPPLVLPDESTQPDGAERMVYQAEHVVN
jgi:hypothetical protein